MKINRFAARAFKTLGATAIVAGVALAGVQVLADSGVSDKIDSYAFNHLNTTVFQPAHDYMKGEYTAFAYNGKNRDVLAVKLPIVEEQIAQAENKGLFDNPKQFKDTMAELQLDRKVSGEYLAAKWKSGGKLDPEADSAAIEKIKSNIRNMRDTSWDLHMPKQIGSTGTPG